MLFELPWAAFRASERNFSSFQLFYIAEIALRASLRSFSEFQGKLSVSLEEVFRSSTSEEAFSASKRSYVYQGKRFRAPYTSISKGCFSSFQKKLFELRGEAFRTSKDCPEKVSQSLHKLLEHSRKLFWAFWGRNFLSFMRKISVRL